VTDCFLNPEPQTPNPEPLQYKELQKAAIYLYPAVLAINGCQQLSDERTTARQHEDIIVEYTKRRIFAIHFSLVSICFHAFRNMVKSRFLSENRSRAISSWSALAKPLVSQHRLVFVTQK